METVEDDYLNPPNTIMRDLHDYSLKLHNTFGIDARCSRYMEYTSVEEAQRVAAELREHPETPFLIIGGGSNLLLTDDYNGTVVKSACKGIEVNATEVTCGSGERWDNVVKFMIEHKLYGAENLSLIPGDVGASAVQNIGAYGVEVKDFISTIQAVEIATGNVCQINNKDCNYSYRYSRFKDEWRGKFLITSVTYNMMAEFVPHIDYGNIRAELERQGIDKPTAGDLRKVIIDIRRQKLPDPEETGNAGSFFMNPVVDKEKYELLAAQHNDMPHYSVGNGKEKIPAGWLIDKCGWKGRTMGKAGVHDRQALVLVNRGGATGMDILRLCQAIQSDVKQKFGIQLVPEVNIV